MEKCYSFVIVFVLFASNLVALDFTDISLNIGALYINATFDADVDFQSENSIDAHIGFVTETIAPDFSASFSLARFKSSSLLIRAFLTKFQSTNQLLGSSYLNSSDASDTVLDVDSQVEVVQLYVQPIWLFRMKKPHQEPILFEFGVGGLTYWTVTGNGYITEETSNERCAQTVSEIKEAGEASREQLSRIETYCEKVNIQDSKSNPSQFAPFGKISIYDFYLSATLETIAMIPFLNSEASPISSYRLAMGYETTF